MLPAGLAARGGMTRVKGGDLTFLRTERRL